jgi:MSHA biogenesis protein MshP
MMAPKRQAQPALRRIGKLSSYGFSLVSAIFLLVILAGLGAAIVYISGVQQTSSTLDIQGARAYQAARAGVEWGLFQQIKNASCVDTPGTSFTMPAGTSLSIFTVTVVCHKTAGAVSALDRYQITSIACNAQAPVTSCATGVGGGTGFVQRVMQVEF